MQIRAGQGEDNGHKILHGLQNALSLQGHHRQSVSHKIPLCIFGWNLECRHGVKVKKIRVGLKKTS